MKNLVKNFLIGATIICFGMSTRQFLAFGGEWLLGLTIIGFGFYGLRKRQKKKACTRFFFMLIENVYIGGWGW